jgi:hypothetical protein
MDDLGDAYATLSDPLNEPPPPTPNAGVRITPAGGSALEQLLTELSVSHRWRIKRMIRDYNWLEGIATKRGISPN